MATKKRRRLGEAEKSFLVRQLACYASPKEAADSLKAEMGFEVSPQAAEAYDPNKRMGRSLAKKWRDLFERTREAFLKHIEDHVPEAHKAVRVRHLASAARAFQSRGNYVAQADMLERIAKEMGNVHTNRREHTGKNGGPVEMNLSDLTEEQINARLAELLGVEAPADG